MEKNTEFELDIRYYIKLLWKKKWLIIAFFIISVVFAVFFVKTLNPIYKTSAKVMVSSNSNMQNLVFSDLFLENNNSATYRYLLKSRTVLERVINELEIKDDDGKYISPDQLGSMLMVNQIPGTDLLEISLEHTDPVLAYKIVNAVINIFEDENTKKNKLSIKNARTFIEKQLQDVQENLKKAEENLLSFKQENQIFMPTEEAKGILAKLTEIDSQKAMMEIELKSIENTMELTLKELQAQDNTIISSKVLSKNPLINQYKLELADLENNLIMLKNKYADTHPDVINLENQIKHIREKLKNEAEKEISAQTESFNPLYEMLYRQHISLEVERLAGIAKLNGLEQLLEKYKNDLQGLPQKELELVRLERVAKVTGELYIMLMKRLEEIKISEAMLTSDIYIVDSAYLPDKPVKPNRPVLVFVVGILSLFISVFFIILRDAFDTTVKSVEEIENMLNVSVIGSIPDLTNKRNMK